jgi:hypothetical protein
MVYFLNMGVAVSPSPLHMIDSFQRPQVDDGVWKDVARLLSLTSGEESSKKNRRGNNGYNLFNRQFHKRFDRRMSNGRTIPYILQTLPLSDAPYGHLTDNPNSTARPNWDS